MYKVDEKIKVNWTIEATIAIPMLSDISVIKKIPDNTTNTPEAINTEDYVPATYMTKGNVTYIFTPNLPGLWVISLLISDILISKQEIFVSKTDSSVKKFVDGDLF